ncbi:MAG: hypothetical protein ACREDO_00535 [Methyloceanibacter sp.]
MRAILDTNIQVGTLFTLFVVPVFYSLIAAQHRPSPANEEIEQEAQTTLNAMSAACMDRELTDRQPGCESFTGKTHDAKLRAG